MAFKFVVLCSVLAVASAGIIAEPSYSSYSAPAHSSSFTKTLSYTEPKAAYVASPAVATYSSYDPHHYQPTHSVIATPHYEHGQSEQSIVRSAHGTVSQISKSVDTPTSSVRKYVNTKTNDGYKTVSYAPAYVQQPATYVHQPATTYVSQPATTYVQAPVQKTYISQPTTYVQQPAIQKTYINQPATYVQQPATTYIQQAPVQKTYVSQPAVYAQSAPVVATKVHYSPAVEVAHFSYESPISHYAW
ncbi:unnamed protein product [Chironomus riparius]|uniref:Cuticular protein n=1 Tax=Chironomus riparius TaxID=315576 RepID=A0A9N9S271_9DIPT|nr:unnamed protein product [Chironomus riparius]